MRPLVQRIGHVTLGVPDPAAAAEDAVAMLGLRIVEAGDGRMVLSSNDRSAELVFNHAERSEIQICGLEAVSAAAVDAVRARCENAKLEILSDLPSLSGVERAVTFATSEGHVFEVHTPLPSSASERLAAPGLRARSLDHINVTAEDPERFTREMNTGCGLLLSQRSSGYEISWMRAGNYRHHTVAVVKSRTGVHHISWEFASFQDFRTVADGLASRDRRIVWGPGRHGPGDNLFIYYRDVSGFMTECIAEMEVILDDDQPAIVVDPGENLSNYKVVNQWGALPPQDWIDHHTPFARYRAGGSQPGSRRDEPRQDTS